MILYLQTFKTLLRRCPSLSLNQEPVSSRVTAFGWWWISASRKEILPVSRGNQTYSWSCSVGDTEPCSSPITDGIFTLNLPAEIFQGSSVWDVPWHWQILTANTNKTKKTQYIHIHMSPLVFHLVLYKMQWPNLLRTRNTTSYSESQLRY